MQIIKYKKQIIILTLAALLAGCAKGNGISMLPYNEQHDGPAGFILCHGFSCSEKTYVALKETQWNKVAAVFKPAAKTPEQERKQIENAIAVMETEVIKTTGLKPDHGEANTFEPDQAQMDCIDEAINTTHYIEFFEQAGFLKHHDPAPPIHRGFFIDGQWPHNSGAVKEKDGGEIYAIDSYYFDAGKPAVAVPLDVWLDEWRPANLPPRSVPKRF